jgi:hypothetical protein
MSFLKPDDNILPPQKPCDIFETSKKSNKKNADKQELIGNCLILI